MLINLKEFFSGERSRLDIDYSFSMGDVAVDGLKPFVSPVSVKGRLRFFADSVELTAEVAYDYSMPCNRCMEETLTRRRQKIFHVLARSLNEDEDDTYVQVEDVLDLDALLYADIILELPTKYICKEDCRGLCPQCGVNRNKETCNCGKSGIDPRLEALKALLEN